MPTRCLITFYMSPNIHYSVIRLVTLRHKIHNLIISLIWDYLVSATFSGILTSSSLNSRPAIIYDRRRGIEYCIGNKLEPD